MIETPVFHADPIDRSGLGIICYQRQGYMTRTRRLGSTSIFLQCYNDACPEARRLSIASIAIFLRRYACVSCA